MLYLYFNSLLQRLREKVNAICNFATFSPFTARPNSRRCAPPSWG